MISKCPRCGYEGEHRAAAEIKSGSIYECEHCGAVWQKWTIDDIKAIASARDTIHKNAIELKEKLASAHNVILEKEKVVKYADSIISALQVQVSKSQGYCKQYDGKVADLKQQIADKEAVIQSLVKSYVTR